VVPAGCHRVERYGDIGIRGHWAKYYGLGGVLCWGGLGGLGVGLFDGYMARIGRVLGVGRQNAACSTENGIVGYPIKILNPGPFHTER